jgi:dienelactone hydrolase
MITTQAVEYRADGIDLVGHLAYDGAVEGRRPAALVAHEGPGLDDHAKDVAERLAGLGYVAFALDYMGGGVPAASREAMMDRLGGLMGDPARIRALAAAGLDVLLAQPQADPARAVTVGFCFGGTLCLELARSGADVKATVGMHSGLGTARPAEPGAIHGLVLACIGADDPLVPAEQRGAFEEEMRAAGADWRLYVFGGAVHSFTNPAAVSMDFPGVAYHRPTDERSWRAMLDAFTEAAG